MGGAGDMREMAGDLREITGDVREIAGFIYLPTYLRMSCSPKIPSPLDLAGPVKDMT